jgi:hypothetical protein
MKHLKSITELNSETYDKISQTVSQRGDVRGKRISDTAVELKDRNTEWTENERKKKFENLPELETSTEMSLQTNRTVDVKILDMKLNFDNSQQIEMKVLRDNEHGAFFIDMRRPLRDRIITQNGKSINLSRKSARDLANIINSNFEFGHKISANDFSQH